MFYVLFAYFNSKLYAIWAESSQIRVAVYNGNESSPSWTFIDGNASKGLLEGKCCASEAVLAVHNNKLYAAWWEGRGNYQTRIAVYNGDDSAPSWSFVDGGSGIKKSSKTQARYGDMISI